MDKTEGIIRALRPLANHLITEADVRRAREHDAAIGRGGTVKGGKVRGTIPPSARGVVQASSVQLAPSSFSNAEDLATRIAAIEAAILALQGEG